MQTFASPQTVRDLEVFQGGIAILTTINVSVSIRATVPATYPYFCTGLTISGLNCANANGDYIDFGELSATNTSHGTSQKC